MTNNTEESRGPQKNHEADKSFPNNQANQVPRHQNSGNGHRRGVNHHRGSNKALDERKNLHGQDNPHIDRSQNQNNRPAGRDGDCTVHYKNRQLNGNGQRRGNNRRDNNTRGTHRQLTVSRTRVHVSSLQSTRSALDQSSSPKPPSTPTDFWGEETKAKDHEQKQTNGNPSENWGAVKDKSEFWVGLENPTEKDVVPPETQSAEQVSLWTNNLANGWEHTTEEIKITKDVPSMQDVPAVFGGWANSQKYDLLATARDVDSVQLFAGSSSSAMRYDTAAEESNFRSMGALKPEHVDMIHKWLELQPNLGAWDNPARRYTTQWWIVPRQWAEYPSIEGMNRDQFWSAYHGFHPQPQHHSDIDTVPWWEKLVKEGGPYIIQSEQPRAPMDPSDEMYTKAKCCFTSSKTQVDEKVEQKRKEDKENGIVSEYFEFEADLGPLGKPSCLKINNQNRNTYRKPPVRAEYQGHANMYIRLAVEADLPQLKDIYNHFVENTWYTSDRNPLNDWQMRSRFQEVELAGWPWLVAIERSGRHRYGKNNKRGSAYQTVVATGEKVMGFAYASDHIHRESTDRYTAQVQIWVLPECQYSKVGTTLMDRILFCLLKDYKSMTESEYRVTSAPFNKAGACKREPHSIMASMQYAPDGQDETRSNIVCGFLRKYGFKQYGEQIQVACRKNLSLNRRLFQRLCWENADGCHSENERDDTDSMKNGRPSWIHPDDRTPEAIERQRLERLADEEAAIRRPLPLNWRPFAQR